jgi:hypothetical protein
MALASDHLTANFTYGELRAHLAPPQTIGNLRSLAQYLEVVRGILAVPIKVTSGYRSPSHNASIPGASPTSDHVNGLAADILPLGMSQREAYRRLQAAASSGALPPFDQIIYYPFQHIHIGLGVRKRNQVLIRVAERRYATLSSAQQLPSDAAASAINVVLAVVVIGGILLLAFTRR